MKSIRLAIVLAGVCLISFFPDRVGPGQGALGEVSPASAITSILADQQSAWNRGDVDGFMKGYWESPQLTFAGSSGITRGWQPVLERYRKNYPDQKTMGHLDFTEVEVRPLGKEAALVLGRWHLRRDSDELGGAFTLVFQRFPEGWRIIHDHTSADSKKS
jgi:beta-aspartyl-peptidase (threonine type)